MTLNPVSSFMNFCRNEFPEASRACKTASEKVMNFAEEMTMFFKNHRVKPMPDPRLMLVLQKDQTRKKKRTVAKLEGSERLWIPKKQPEKNNRFASEEDVYYS